MVNDHTRQRKNQILLLDEYTRMIDIGIQKIPRFDQAPQTDLSLASFFPKKFGLVQDTIS